jgi:AmmeMemoRadiSam system protein B
VAPRLRRDLRTHEFLVEEGRRRRFVADWIGRGRAHPGYAFGDHAGRLLDLFDGRPQAEIVAAARERVGGAFSADHVARFAASLDGKNLLDNERSRRWLRSMHRAALRRGHRPPATADDSWYPHDPARLAPLVQRLVDDHRAGEARGVRAIISPHAGFAASGTCAGSAHAALCEATPPERVILLGPNHCYRRDEIDVGTLAFDTPLGRLEADAAVARRLRVSLGSCRSNGLAQFRDHSLEMQLPLLQQLAALWRRRPRIVPILISRSMPAGFFRPGEKQLDDLDRLAASLASLLRDRRTAMVVSGDLTHYGSAFDFVPFSDNVNARIRALDQPALEALLALDDARFLESLATRNWCGGPSFYVLIKVAALLGWAPRLIDYHVPPEEEWRPHGRTASFAAVGFAQG